MEPGLRAAQNNINTSILVGKTIMKLAREGHDNRIKVYLHMLISSDAMEQPERALAITDMFVSDTPV
ncbi:MAG TPA: hypothetical protein PK200_18460 [Spirochaetota bacterium]|jgi:hypothetical protein|nr:hypothetical protein [Spirochaetota bacterium]